MTEKYPLAEVYNILDYNHLKKPPEIRDENSLCLLSSIRQLRKRQAVKKVIDSLFEKEPRNK